MALNVDILSVDDVLKEFGRYALYSAGVWSYNSGTGNGTDSNSGRIVGIAITAPTDSAAIFTIGAGPNITVPANTTVNFEPKGLTTATVNISNSASWIVERVS